MSKLKQPPGRPRSKGLVARRQEEILAAASRVFAEQGYRQTDVQVVADRVGVGKGTVYRYFPTKEELFLAAVDRGINRLEERVNEAAAEVDDGLAKITAAVRAYLAFFDEDGDLLELIVQERAEFKDRKQSVYFARREAGYASWRGLVKKLIDEGRIRRMPADRVLDVMSNLLYGVIFTNRLIGRRKSFDAQANDVLDVFFCGVLPREAANPSVRN